MDFGKRLRELRETKGLSQKKVANDLNIKDTTYRNYENLNRQPDYNTLIAIANYHNVSTDYLLGRTKKITNDRTCDDETMNKYEKKLLDIFNVLDDVNKGRVIQFSLQILKESKDELSATDINKKAI